MLFVSVRYEDQDMEDLDQQEFQTCAKAYDVLQDRCDEEIS